MRKNHLRYSLAKTKSKLWIKLLQRAPETAASGLMPAWEMPNISPEAPSLSSLSPLSTVLQGALACEAAQKTSQGEIKVSLIYSFTWRLQVALPTDPLNTSQKLVISFLRVLICRKNNKSQAVFVLSGLWFRAWAQSHGLPPFNWSPESLVWTLFLLRTLPPSAVQGLNIQ